MSGLVIGICGYAGSGKSTVAQVLVDHCGMERRHIGAPLKAMLEVFDLTDEEINGALKEKPCDKLLGKSPRHAQITLGTEWGRNMIHPDLWLWHWCRGVGPNDRVINDSVRFPNEAQAIREMGGVIVRVDRPGVGPIKFRWGPIGRWLYRVGIMAGVHPSERLDRIKPNYVIRNEADIADLRLDTVFFFRDLEPLVAEEPLKVAA